MINLYTYLEAWEKVDDNTLHKGVRKELLKNARKILKEQEDLHHSGLDRFGNELGRYSIATEKITNGRKKAGELFNLHDTGSFHDNMYVQVREYGNDIELILGSLDSKEALIERKLGQGNASKGKRIWGLTDSTVITESTKDGIINELNKIGK
ncbi:hypothetical protein GO491_11785 [Flavobacteriaceae bacterium Ap0902]|nr:hypothetical protein [Flavobacteriaceae bacterium Ap0902]